ncbi:unnamed protein product [Boreogadus saida]
MLKNNNDKVRPGLLWKVLRAEGWTVITTGGPRTSLGHVVCLGATLYGFLLYAGTNADSEPESGQGRGRMCELCNGQIAEMLMAQEPCAKPTHMMECAWVYMME